VPKDWASFFFPAAFTTKARLLANFDLSNPQNLSGESDDLLLEFGDLILAAKKSDQKEEISDHMCQLLLRACNPSPQSLLEVPQSQTLHTKVGQRVFASTPDGAVVTRPNNVAENTYMHLVVGDKARGSKNVDFQIQAEMLAAAHRNFYLRTDVKIPQTIFAIRMIGMSVSIYRADFSVAYLESLAHAKPSQNITIFRVGGSVVNTNLADKAGRNLALQLVSSAMSACWSLSKDLRQITQNKRDGGNVVPAITRERLYWLEEHKLN